MKFEVAISFFSPRPPFNAHSRAAIGCCDVIGWYLFRRNASVSARVKRLASGPSASTHWAPVFRRFRHISSFSDELGDITNLANG